MRALPPILVTLALVGAACSGGDDTSSPSSTSSPSDSTVPDGSTPSGSGGAGQFVRALQPFSDCNAFLGHIQTEAQERVGPYGLDGGGQIWFEDDVVRLDVAETVDSDSADDSVSEGGGDNSTTVGVPAPADPADPAPGALGGSDEDGGFSTTNVQEVGIDEPDIVKTDGERILTIRNNTLTLIEVNGSSSQVTGRLNIPEGWGHELFFRGDRALIFTNGDGGGISRGPIPVEPAIDGGATVGSIDPGQTEPTNSATPVGSEYYGPSALVIEVDLSDPANLRVAASMRIEGNYLSARAIGETVRLAMSSGPQQLPFLYPQTPAGEERAIEANQDIISDSTLDDWMPNFTITADGATTSGPLLDCDRMHHPADFAGFDVVSVVEVDLGLGLADGFDQGEAIGVLAGGQTIYSSMDRFYVATTKWAEPDLALDEDIAVEWNEDYQTDIHAFSISEDTPTDYVASGGVDGSLLNQFSLDEHEGYLRVITTEGSPWGGSDLSESRLVVLEEQGQQLVSVGEVGGLGKGERLYAARLMGDVGFAVTFRQTDPFYVLDLSDPTNPKVSGELKIPGFSTYLHPVDDNFVLGIGQDADENGNTRGLKMSLFDVSNPADPREVSVWTMANANSVAEYDHRAFLMWGSTAVLPVQSWSDDFNGVILFDVDGGITEAGRVTHTENVITAVSDCQTITSEGISEDSELFWMTQDRSTQVQLCGEFEVGGFGTSWCESIPTEEIPFWFGDEAEGRTFLESIGAGDNSRIEICYPDDFGGRDQIDRSLVIDQTLWTLSNSAIQANHLPDLTWATQLQL